SGKLACCNAARAWRGPCRLPRTPVHHGRRLPWAPLAMGSVYLGTRRSTDGAGAVARAGPRTKWLRLHAAGRASGLSRGSVGCHGPRAPSWAHLAAVLLRREWVRLPSPSRRSRRLVFGHAARLRRLLDHAQRMHVDGQNGLLLLPIGGAFLAQGQDLAQRLDVEPRCLGLQIFVADVAGQRLFLLLEPLDLFDELAQLLLRRNL